MSVHQPVIGASARRRLPMAASVLLGLAAVFGLAMIPVVFQDPDARQGASAIGFLIFGAINGGLALLAVFGWRSRRLLIAVSVSALLTGLVSLDGVVAFSAHSSGPWIELPLMWAAFVADMLAGVTAIFAAVRLPRGAAAHPTRPHPSGA